MKYVVEFESANYAGAPCHIVVEAECEYEAEDLCTEFCEEYYREQDEEQYYDENGDEDEPCWSSVVAVFPFEEWEYAHCYPDVATSEEKQIFLG